jgi:ECF sigma factor
MSDVARVLASTEAGDPQAAEQLLPLVYHQLRQLAAARLTQEQPGQSGSDFGAILSSDNGPAG